MFLIIRKHSQTSRKKTKLPATSEYKNNPFALFFDFIC